VIKQVAEKVFEQESKKAAINFTSVPTKEENPLLNEESQENNNMSIDEEYEDLLFEVKLTVGKINELKKKKGIVNCKVRKSHRSQKEEV
jgi:hypothetical protein